MNKGLYISGEFTRSGKAAKAIHHYYEATEGLARILASMFKVLFPEVYKRYTTAFEAGVWEKADTGPFLARAIVYKLQVELHQDQHEDGPFVSFPCGDFTGGEIVVPQLGAKLACVHALHESYVSCLFYDRYHPGDICFFCFREDFSLCLPLEPI